MRALCFCLCLAAPPALGQGIDLYGETTASYSSGLSVESYLEASQAGFYAGVWALSGTAPEIDLYAGFRGSLAAVNYDLSLTRYIYPGDSSGTELTLSLGKDVGPLHLDTDLIYEPDTALGSLMLEAEFDASDHTFLSASYGLYEADHGPADREWGISAEHALSDRLTAEASFADGNTLPGTFSLSLVWESR